MIGFEAKIGNLDGFSDQPGAIGHAFTESIAIPRSLSAALFDPFRMAVQRGHAMDITLILMIPVKIGG